MFTSTEDSDDAYKRPTDRRPKVSIAWLRDIAKSGSDTSLDSLIIAVRRGPRFYFTDERQMMGTLFGRDY